MRPVFRRAVDVGVEPVGRHIEAVERLRPEAGGERRLHFHHPEDTRGGAGHREAHAGRVLRHHDPGEGVARRLLLELGVAGLFRHREAHAEDQLVVLEGGFEHPGEEIVGGDAAAVGVDGGAEPENHGRIVGRRIVVGDRAADGAAIAHLRIADVARQIGQRRDRPLRVGRIGHRVMGGHRPDEQRCAVDGDGGEAADSAEIDDVGRLGEALFHDRDQGHAAGDEFPVGRRRERRNGLGDR